MAIRNRLHRSELAVPGSNLRMLEKAPTAGADMVFLDLEDAVVAARKAVARQNVADYLRQSAAGNGPCQSVWVRINALDTDAARHDLAAVIPAGPDGIMLPKAHSAQQVRTLAGIFLDRCPGFDGGLCAWFISLPAE